MRLATLVLAAALALPLTARATGDAAAAGSNAVLGLQAPAERFPAVGLTASNTGFSVTRSDAKGFFYLAGQWNQLATLELGFGGATLTSGPLTLWGAGGLVAAPIDGLSIGLRGLAGAVWHYGGPGFFFRPGLTLAPAFTASSTHGLHVVMPLDVSIELGLDLGNCKPFLRLAAGVDPVASPYFVTARGQVLLGVSATFDPPPPAKPDAPAAP